MTGKVPLEEVFSAPNLGLVERLPPHCKKQKTYKGVMLSMAQLEELPNRFERVDGQDMMCLSTCMMVSGLAVPPCLSCCRDGDDVQCLSRCRHGQRCVREHAPCACRAAHAPAGAAGAAAGAASCPPATNQGHPTPKAWLRQPAPLHRPAPPLHPHPGPHPDPPFTPCTWLQMAPPEDLREFYQQLRPAPAVAKRIEEFKQAQAWDNYTWIGVHIRRGDFGDRGGPVDSFSCAMRRAAEMQSDSWHSNATYNGIRFFVASDDSGVFAQVAKQFPKGESLLLLLLLLLNSQRCSSAGYVLGMTATISIPCRPLPSSALVIFSYNP